MKLKVAALLQCKDYQEPTDLLIRDNVKSVDIIPGKDDESIDEIFVEYKYYCKHKDHKLTRDNSLLAMKTFSFTEGVYMIKVILNDELITSWKVEI